MLERKTKEREREHWRRKHEDVNLLVECRVKCHPSFFSSCLALAAMVLLIRQKKMMMMIMWDSIYVECFALQCLRRISLFSLLFNLILFLFLCLPLFFFCPRELLLISLFADFHSIQRQKKCKFSELWKKSIERHANANRWGLMIISIGSDRF